MAIFAELVEQAGCPDLIGLQEIGTRLEQLIPPMVETLCDGGYTIAWQAAASPDREMVLSRLPIVERGYLDIANFPWEAYWVRVDTPSGPVDFLTTHFASSSNNPDCQPGRCPPVCCDGHLDQPVQRGRGRRLLPATPGEAVAVDRGRRPERGTRVATLTTLTDAGFRDAWLESGRPECDPATHVGCTGGGDAPEPFVGMDTERGRGLRRSHRLCAGATGRRIVMSTLEVAGFADKPRSSPLNGMFWPADHAGRAGDDRLRVGRHTFA